MSRVLAAAVAAVLSISVSAFAQDDKTVPTLVFRDNVIVTAERGEARQTWIPAATVVLDGKSLAALPAVSLGEFLSFVPGFRVQQAAFTGGRPVVSARGFFGGGEAEYVAMFVDGVRIADAESGLVDWSAIAGSAVTRVEAARGPGASLYGDAAIGGVVQVLTESPSTSPVITVSGGSLGTFSLDGTWRWKTPSLGGFLSGVARRTDGISEHSDASEFSVGVAAGGKVRAVSLRWTATALGRDQEEPGVLTLSQRDQGVTLDPAFRFDDRNRRSFQTALVARSAAATWTQQSRIGITTRTEDSIRTILLAPGLGDTHFRDLETSGVSGSFELERAIGAVPNSMLRVGVDLERQHLDTAYSSVRSGVAADDTVGAADGSRVRAGAFASTSWMPADAVRLYGALRWDRIDDSDFAGGADQGVTDAWSPRAGIVVQPPALGGASLFGQYSRAFKAPTLDQMFDPRPYPDFRGGTFTISNPQLTAQEASNIEAGLSGGSRVRWSALGYRMNVTNEIDFDASTFSYANIGESLHTGIEAEVQGAINDYVRPVASYALSDVSKRDDRSLQLKNVPRHQLMLGVAATFPAKIDAFVSLRRTWGAFVDDANEVAVPTGALVDVRVRRAIRRATVFVDLMNAFDQRYDEFGYTLADFRGGSVAYVYPGQPRVVRAGVTIR